MERRLEISDIATQQGADIKENPYRFLYLPEDASVADARRAYIGLSKTYHPDLVNPRFDAQQFGKLYSQQDFESIDEKIASALGVNQELLFETISESLTASALETDKKEGEKKAQALDAIRAAAHEKMIILNRAYEEIKLRFSPKEWNTLAGYDFEKYYDYEEGGYDNRRVNLEGKGELDIYPNHYEHWVSGTYLSFDYGPIPDHPWYDWILRHSVAIKHMFVYMELQEGRDKISRVLLEPFFDNFQLNDQRQELFMELLIAREPTEEIMKKMDIPDDYGISAHEFDKWYYPNRFRRHTNEMKTLLTEPTRIYNQVELRLEDGKLILKEYGETVFSEADFVLFSTLAYGPMIREK